MRVKLHLRVLSDTKKSLTFLKPKIVDCDEFPESRFFLTLRHLLSLCQMYSQHSSNLKPEVIKGTDFIFVRELTGGLYFGKPKKKWQTIKNTPEKMRLTKDKSEIHALKKSQQINGETLKRIKKLCKPGLTELEIAWKIKTIGHDLGTEDISFEPIVAFGPSSSSPHHQNGNRKLKKRDIVLIDMGMKYKGYCSDMTRTFFLGKPTTQQENVYQKVLDAQLAGIAQIKAGAKAASVDKAARKSMGEDEKYFGHSFGHGIGLDVHESPNLSSKSKDILKENMIVTAEPGIYLPGKFGVRIEDMGRVTKTGYENFTKIVK